MSSKNDVNRRWTSSDKYRDAYDRLFAKEKKEEADLPGAVRVEEAGKPKLQLEEEAAQSESETGLGGEGEAEVPETGP